MATLRVHRPAYTLSTLGVNADHKTVKSAVDAFGRDRVSADHPFVLAAHATSPRDRLERKWLYDVAAESARLSRSVTGEDGDVVKAGRVAAAIRAESPDAKVILILTTNRVPSLELLIAIGTAEKRYDVEIEVFDRSSIAHVLDYTADGTAIRRELLGIETDRVSRRLLEEIGERSATMYARLHFGLEPTEWTDRATSFHLNSLSADQTLIALIGQSGFGKSAVALQVLRAHLRTGRIGVWVRAELIERAASLDAVLDLAIREFHPTVEPNAADRARALADSGHPILLVVDDVMRLTRPQQMLATLIAWAEAESESKSPSAIILVPIWPSLWATQRNERTTSGWIRSVDVGALGDNQATALLRRALAARGIVMSEPEAAEAARPLCGDPFLTALLVATATNTRANAADVLPLALNTLASYIDTSIVRLAAPGGAGRFMASTYRRALKLLARVRPETVVSVGR